MFWNSILGALNSLAHWQTYIAAIVFVVLLIAPMVLIGFLSSRSSVGMALASFSPIFVMPLVHVFALIVFVLMLSPIMLGLSDDAAWALPWNLLIEKPMFFLKVAGKLAVFTIVLALIPILGSTTSLHTLLVGSYSLAIFLGLLGSLYPQVNVMHVAFWPGFWFVLGLVVVGGLMAWVGTMCAVLLASIVESKAEGFGRFLMAPLNAVFGLLPLFIYSAWIGQQVRVN